MSFGSGGFGSNSGGFGGFGSNSNPPNTTSSSLFGGNTATSGGFGGFGNTNTASSNPFGAPKTGGFGSTPASTGGSLFGGGATTTAGGFGSGGGFGANTASNTGATLGTGFGSNNTGSLFGGPKTTGGFGTTNSSTGGLFGGNNTTSGFGGSNTASNPFAANNNAGSSLFGANNAAGGGFGNTNNATASTFGGFGNNSGSTANQGTAGTPFTPVTEKDGGAAGMTSSYQTITMQPQYQGKSLEELRLEDYAQGRRLPQSGSFGSSNTFGGFNTNNTAPNNSNRPLFGNTAAPSGGFGASSNPGFGAPNTTFGANNTNSSTGLFGAKTSTPSLFGNNNTTNAAGGFGANATTGTSLFGNNNTANATGTAFGGFGSNTTNTTGTNLFGNNNNTPAKTGFGFGPGSTSNNATTGTSLFGNAVGNTTQSANTGLFGNNNTSGSFGQNTGNSLFGNNNAQPKAGTGLFGAAAGTNNNGTGLFGAAAQPANSGFASNTNTGLFGSNNAAATGTGLFGSANQPKNGTGLFGATNNNVSTGSGLFGAANNTTGTGLFGNTANNGSSLFNNPPRPAGNSLFGNNAGTGSTLFGNNNTSGSGLFGSNNASTSGAGLFGATQNQGNATGSLFGNSQGQPNQNQLTASITGDPYGNAQLFASLASPSPPVGPLATPLNGAKPTPKARASLLASVRGSPMMGNNSTPRARPGYGFSYSSYNTPNSSTPILTPGASSLLRPTGSLGSALSTRLAKSFSTSNLRGELGEGQSLIRTPAQGQGSLLLGGSGSLGSGNIRKLKIDRSLRTDLFSDTAKKPTDATREKKGVSFDPSASKQDSSSTAKPSAANALVVRDEEADKTEQSPSQVNGNSSLSTVQEESGNTGNDHHPEQSTPRKPIEAGEYYTEPQLKHVQAMSRSQLANIKSFTVGRQGVGKIVFGRGTTIDLTGVPLDDVCGKIVQLKPRSATVYEDDSDKPPVGKGLNVPSTIYLEQSWPRKARVSGATPQSTSATEVERHRNRLRKVSGTTFVEYNADTGVWSFTVEHFTTYELDDEDETTVQDTASTNPSEHAGTSTPTGDKSFDADKSMESAEAEEQDDTFEFKLAKRSHPKGMTLPGGFEDSMADLTYDDDDEQSADAMQADNSDQEDNQRTVEDPFVTNEHDARAPSTFALQRQEEFVPDKDVDESKGLPGSFQDDLFELKSILKPSEAGKHAGSPNLANMMWEDQLQRTLSPKKRDRQALKELQPTMVKKVDSDPETLLQKSLLTRSQLGQGHLAMKGKKQSPEQTPEQNAPSEAFKTSMDIMKSLWANDRQTSGLLEASRAINRARYSRSRLDSAGGKTDASSAVDAHGASTARKSVSMMSQSALNDVTSPAIQLQQRPENTQIEVDDDQMDDDSEDGYLPEVTTSAKISFASLAQVTSDSYELSIWRLCSALFDAFDDACPAAVRGKSEEWIMEYSEKLRQDVVFQAWNEQLAKTVHEQLQTSATAEATAIYHLTVGDVLAASEALGAAGNHKLAILVAQLPGNSATNREMLQQQIVVWQNRQDWSEFSLGQRALYSLLAGDTSLSTEFGLSWMQSFALKARYGGADNLEQAIENYVTDLPSSAHAKTEDTFLSLLKVIIGVDVAELFDSKATSRRIAWQLATLLSAKGNVRPDDDQMDGLTTDLAAEEESAGRYLDGLWVLLHLNDDESRLEQIKAILQRNSSKLGASPETSSESEDSDYEVYNKITQDLSIHPALFYAAKAGHARDVEHNYVLQCDYLLHASGRDNLQAAHTVLCCNIGPTAVIEQSYDVLERICQSMNKIGAHNFEKWRHGGQVYLEFAQFMQLPIEARHKKEGIALLKKLDKSLLALAEEDQDDLTLEMKVARLEMRKEVKENVKAFEHADAFKSMRAESYAPRGKGNVLLERYMHALGKVN